MTPILIPCGHINHFPYLMATLAVIRSLPGQDIYLMTNSEHLNTHFKLVKGILKAENRVHIFNFPGKSLAQMRALSYYNLYENHKIKKIVAMDCDILWHSTYQLQEFIEVANDIMDHKEDYHALTFSYCDIINLRKWPDYSSKYRPIIDFVINFDSVQRDKAAFFKWDLGAGYKHELLREWGDYRIGHFDGGRFNITNGLINLKSFVENPLLMKCWTEWPYGLRGHDTVASRTFPDWREKFGILFGFNTDHIGILDPVMDKEVWSESEDAKYFGENYA